MTSVRADEQTHLTWKGVPTTALERAFVALVIVALPTENYFLFLPGFSLQFVLFSVIAAYVVSFRYRALVSVAGHPALLAGYLFVALGFAMEWTHEHASYYELIRVGQMIAGALLLAVLCRDLRALHVACFGYWVAGLSLSVMLFLTSYGTLSAATANDFQAASQLRAEAFEDNPLQANLNNMAFSAGQAAVIALSWSLLSQHPLHRWWLGGTGVFCLVGAFLPLSRSGVVIVLSACTSVLYAFGFRHVKGFVIAAILGGAVLMLVPQAVWSRMSFTFEQHDGKTEGRALVYGAALDRLPEYVLTGIGAGNFWSHWGRRTELASASGRVSGTHNCFLQVTMYWGIVGLITLLAIFWQASHCLPRNANREPAALALVGISVSILLFSMVSHNIYAKEFTLALGLLVGAHRWIWPYGVLTTRAPWRDRSPQPQPV